MQQVREAFPWDQTPRYLLRDRDAIYGRDFAAVAKGMGMEDVVTAPRAPWQNPFVERSSAPSGENACHVIVWNRTSLRRTLRRYFAYYEGCRTHLSLEKDSPVSRSVEPLAHGYVIEIPQVGGLHHLYTRKAA